MYLLKNRCRCAGHLQTISTMYNGRSPFGQTISGPIFRQIQIYDKSLYILILCLPMKAWN